MSKNNNSPALIAQNKKARHYYELLDFLEAGISLTGSEIKSLRLNGASFKDSYVTFKQGEALLLGLYIAPYANAGYAQHEPERPRKLLMHASEIRAWAAKVEQKGLAILPLNLHFKNGRVKVELGLGRGKKLHDHRDSLKLKAENRDAEREMSRH